LDFTVELIAKRVLAKKMKLNWKQWLRSKQNHMLVKSVVAILLMGLAFRLVFFRSTRLSPALEQTPFAEKTVLPEETPFTEKNVLPEETPSSEKTLPAGENPIAEKTVLPKPPVVPTPVSVPVQESGDQVPPRGN
jgi:septal ring-binding cell division protein DamX